MTTEQKIEMYTAMKEIVEKIRENYKNLIVQTDPDKKDAREELYIGTRVCIDWLDDIQRKLQEYQALGSNATKH